MAYHFFPRRPLAATAKGQLPTEADHDRGLRILESIIRFGLLLKPERDAFIRGRPTATPRICFTEATIDDLSRREVPIDDGKCNHFQIFGPYAIGIESKVARELGMSAVLSRASGGDAYKSYTDSLLESLKHIYNAVVVMSHVESIGHPDHDWFLGKENEYVIPRRRLDEEGVTFIAESEESVAATMQRLDNLDEGVARSVEELFETLDPRRLPFWQLAQHLSLLLDMTQEADSNRPNDKRHLAYYKQREWRILRAYHADLNWVPLADADVKRLGFTWEKHEVTLGHRKLFLDEASDGTSHENEWLLTGKGRTPLRSLIAELVYPRCRERQVREMLASLECRIDIKPVPYDLNEKFRP